MDTDREQSESRQTAKASQDQRELLRVTLSCIGDAVITTDKEIRITFLNPVAETLTGWMQEEAIGVPLERVFKIVDEETRRTVENPANRAFRKGVVVSLANHTLLIAKDGTERPIDDSAAPIRHANVKSPEWCEASQAAFRELREKQFIRYDDLPLESKDGQRREVEVVANLYAEDGQSVIQANIRDITERKQAAYNLEVSEARYRRLFETAQDAPILRP